MKDLYNKYKLELIIIILIVSISVLHYAFGYNGTPLHNLYRLLYVIPIIISSFKYGFKGGVLISLATSLIYSPHILLAVDFGPETIGQLIDVFYFFTVGAISGLLFERKNIELNDIRGKSERYIILEKYTNSIIESIKSGVVAVNNDMLITIINHGAKEILNLNDDYIGQSFKDTIICTEVINEKVIEALYQNRIIEGIEVKIKGDGKDLELRVNVYPLSLENTNKGLVIIFDDITEIKKLQQHIHRNDKLVALGELSTGVAHEIRNPLAIIKAVAQTMKGETQEDIELLKELEIIDEEVERANNIVKGLMDFAKPNKDVMSLCSVDALMQEVIDITSKYVAQNEIKINYYHSKVPQIIASKEALKQAFINLIFNACDAMPDGGELIIKIQNFEEQWVQIIFQDVGIGIEECNIKKIFNPFFTTKEEGTGLGLSIVHKIVEEHMGVIDVFSKIGEGTRFELLFPVNKEGSRS